MFDFLKKRTGTRLGLDIGTSSLKAVQISKKESGYQLKNYALLDFFLSSSGNALISYESTEAFSEKHLISLLKDFLKKGNFSAQEVVISVPVFSSFFTAISLPLMPDKELEGAVRYEAKKYVPLPLEEVELDWLVTNDLRTASKDRLAKEDKKSPATRQLLDILLVAVPKELIARLTRIIRALGLKLVVLEAESFSLVRALQAQVSHLGQREEKDDRGQASSQKGSWGNYMILDSGARSTSLIWLQEQRIRLVHFIDYSGNRVTNYLSQRYHLSFGQIEAGKRGQDFLPQAKPGSDFVIGREEISYLGSLFEKVVSEIKAVINSVQSSSPLKNKDLIKPQFCLVSGGSVYLPGFLSYLNNNLDMPVVRANPFLGLDAPANLESTLEQIGPLMGVAAGLALR